MKGKSTFTIAGLLLLGLVLHLAGCSDGSDGSNSRLQWGDCPSYFGDYELQCATVQLPLDHYNPDAGTISILVARAVGKPAEKKGDVWFIAGGPASSSRYFAENMAAYAKTQPQWNYYTMEHRGVGASMKLECPDCDPPTGGFYGLECYQELETQWGDGVQNFNPSQAALDLGTLIGLTRRPGGKVFLYATSYGTYLAQRFLCLNPQPVNGVVLDGVVPAGLMDDVGGIGHYDQGFEKNGRALMDRCATDPVCMEKMREIAGTDPWQAVEHVFRRVDQEDLCPAFAPLDRPTLRNLLGELSHDWSKRMLVPALVYRLNRCNANDQEAIYRLLEDPDEPAVYQPVSAALRTNIVVSELLGPGIDYDAAVAFAQQSLFSTDLTVYATWARDVAGWPPYPMDGCAYRFPDTDLPILMINGDLDPQTHVDLARFASQAFDGVHQRLVVMSGVPHGAIFESRIQSDYHDKIDTCAIDLAFQFFEDPEKSLDLSCLDQLIQPDFSGTTERALEAAEAVFGRDSVWD